MTSIAVLEARQLVKITTELFSLGRDEWLTKRRVVRKPDIDRFLHVHPRQLRQRLLSRLWVLIKSSEALRVGLIARWIVFGFEGADGCWVLRVDKGDVMRSVGAEKMPGIGGSLDESSDVTGSVTRGVQEKDGAIAEAVPLHQ